MTCSVFAFFDICRLLITKEADITMLITTLLPVKMWRKKDAAENLRTKRKAHVFYAGNASESIVGAQGKMGFFPLSLFTYDIDQIEQKTLRNALPRSKNCQPSVEKNGLLGPKTPLKLGCY